MSSRRRAPARFAVRIPTRVWREEVERFAPGSGARIAAERERASLEEDGVEPDRLLACEREAPDGTRLGGLVKAYVPIGAASSSERPYGFVFSGGRDERGPYLVLVAYGLRHPRDRSRSVYERAHKRLHGRYPGEA